MTGCAVRETKSSQAQGHRKVKTARAYGAGVEVQHAVLAALLGAVGVAENNRVYPGGLGRKVKVIQAVQQVEGCLLYTSPSPRD